VDRDFNGCGGELEDIILIIAIIRVMMGSLSNIY
jgi:hypothetical protein